MARPRGLTASLGAAALLGGSLGACGAPATPKPGATISAYLSAWSAKRYPAMAALVDRAPVTFADTHTQVLTQLKATDATYQPGAAVRRGPNASSPLTSHLMIPGLGVVDLHTTIVLRLVNNKWLIEWTPATVVPGLAAGDKLTTTATWPSRAPVLGAGGAVLTASTQSVSVGLSGSRLKDPAQVSAALVAAGFPAATVAQAISAASANPAKFTTVATISQDRYAQIAGSIYSLPGTSFSTTNSEKTITPDLAAHVIGDVAPVTAEQLKVLGAPYGPTSMVGHNGIEAAYERQLAGAPAVTIDLVGPSGATISTVASRPPTPGRAVQTTIDPTVERAAENALGGVSQPAAMVAIRPSTGEVLASVSRPTNNGFNLAFEGSVPPGSTFKVMTTDALLANGLAPTATLTCPPTISVGGRSFRNDEGEAAPTLTFEQAFAKSCNTAFIGATRALPDAALPAAAARFGIGTTFGLGLPAYGGKVPTPATDVDKAASSIGQGQITVSPLALAVVAATAASGTLHEPRLVAGAADDTAPPATVDPAAIAQLHTFMAAVVAPGGTAGGANLPAGTFGKTGTAEFGTGPHPPTHAWFLGFRGDLAFAVFVYGGGVGGAVAAPRAAKLLAGLPAS
ncbi:MAG: penicillin-binding transpeptidase domain-containing protein [Actinomycetota bacterium]|nr:penicillin-binding transpeptidase domain-containing protein [Actinomycetota bacterium]